MSTTATRDSSLVGMTSLGSYPGRTDRRRRRFDDSRRSDSAARSACTERERAAASAWTSAWRRSDELRDGKIAASRVLPDKAEALEAVGLSE